MKQLLIALLLVLASQMSYAVTNEKVKAEDIARIKARPLILVLREADPDAVKLYEKSPRKQAEYKKEIAAYNERIQKIAPQIWKFNSEILFKPESEVKALQKDKNKEYTIGAFTLQKVKERPTVTAVNDPFKDEMVVPTLNIYLIEKPSAVFGTYHFMDRTPSEPELAIGLMQLQAEYNKAESSALPEDQQPTEALKGKILVLDQAQFKMWISDDEMKKIYPYPYERVDKATIDKLILEQNPKYAILSIVPMVGEPKLMHSVVDLETGSTLSVVVPGAEGTGINYRDSTYITRESIIGYANGVVK